MITTIHETKFHKMLTSNRKFKTTFEYCKVCVNFSESRKISGDWVCFDCIEEGQANTYISTTPKNPEKIIQNKQIIETKKHKPKVEKIIEPKIKFESCTKILKKLFFDNPNRLFKSLEIYDMFENKFKKSNIRNRLSLMAKEGFIYTRRINYAGINSYILCSRNQSLVEDLIPDETAYQYREYIFKHHPVTTPELAAIYNHSRKSICALISTRLKKWVGIQKIRGKNYYYPLDKTE